MSLKDALGFETFNVKNFFKNLKDDPKRAFLGVDPLSTKGWNAILGRDDKPLVNQFGGPTNDTFDKANDAGIKTGTASTLHGIAQTIAGAYGAGNAAGALGSIGGGTTGTAAAGVGGGSTGAGAGIGAALSDTIPEVVVTAGGGGGGAAAAGGGAAAGGVTAANSKSSNNQNLMQRLGNFGNNMQQQGRQEQIDEEKALDALARRGPPPNMGGGNVGPVPVDQYQQALQPSDPRTVFG